MEREVDEFGLLKEFRPELEKIEDGFIPASTIIGLKIYNEGCIGLYLSKNFFYPYTGYKPNLLYFSVREIDNIKYLFIDDMLPINNELVPFIKRASNPNYTHCTIRKITYNKDGTAITRIPCQIISLIPEIKEHKRVNLIRVQVPERPIDVRWQAILL